MSMFGVIMGTGHGQFVLCPNSLPGQFNTRLSPRGVTYYELNNEGKAML